MNFSEKLVRINFMIEVAIQAEGVKKRSFWNRIYSLGFLQR